MPTTPSTPKMFFCRVTAPYDENHMDNLTGSIKTKFYHHTFEEFYYVHETGLKTEKPHYHLLIVCKTTKIEIQKWIKESWKCDGNESFSVSDKYLIDSKDISLAYMLKGGMNKLFERSYLKPGWLLSPTDIDFENSVYIDNAKYIELIEIFKGFKSKTIQKHDNQFETYMTMIKDKLRYEYNESYESILRKIYYLLIKDAIAQRKRIMRCNLWDWSFTLTLHVCSGTEQNKLIHRTIDQELDKKLQL